MATKTKAAAKTDPLDLLAEGDPKDVIALLLWRERFRNPDLSVHLTEKDITEYKACIDFLAGEAQTKKVAVSIYRPQGRPAQEAIAPTKTTRGIAARPAEPARPYVFVGLVDQNGYTIKPIENSEENARRRDQADEVRRARDRAMQLAGVLLGMAQQGVFSNSEIQDAARCLTTLAAAV